MCERRRPGSRVDQRSIVTREPGSRKCGHVRRTWAVPVEMRDSRFSARKQALSGHDRKVKHCERMKRNEEHGGYLGQERLRRNREAHDFIKACLSGYCKLANSECAFPRPSEQNFNEAS